MKKLFTALLFILACTTTVMAQDRRNDNRDKWNANQNNERSVYNERRNASNNSRVVYDDHQADRRAGDERARREEIERMNREYDRRIEDYRNNRSLPSYERDHRIAEIERERKDKNGSFATGAVVGGVLGVLLGVLIAK